MTLTPTTVLDVDLATLLKVGGVMHLGLMAAGLMMPGAVGLRSHLTSLPQFIRRLFWVYYGFIALCLLSFSALTLAFAETLASGAALARAVCAFLAVFWTMRLVVATFVFDLGPYLTSTWRRIGYHATNVVFAYLPIVYGVAAVR
jgi:hypothetical protein